MLEVKRKNRIDRFYRKEYDIIHEISHPDETLRYRMFVGEFLTEKAVFTLERIYFRYGNKRFNKWLRENWEVKEYF
jgi:hypothetical protein